MKKISLKILNCMIYIICWLFSLSSFFCVLSFTPIEKMAFQNGIIMILVFIIGGLASVAIAHFLNRVIIVLRLPMEEWKMHLLRR